MSSFSRNDITILCSVVDNYGDIGFSYRLIRHLQSLSASLRLRLVTDNLEYFSILNPKINPALHHQTCENLEVYDWKDYDLCYKEFKADPPHIILECFQCGQPDWLEKILFEDRVDRPVQIIMIDYLSAEAWVDDFHGLKSLTRTALVPKVNFMPGFTKKTAGLLYNTESACFPNNNTTPQVKHSIKKALFFAYNKDWSPVIKAMNRSFGKDTELLIAQGAGLKSIKTACDNNNVSFIYRELDYFSQPEWDKMIVQNDFMIIRGEDSMAQVCQAGIPFLWQAYPQADDYQLVKVQALLDRMKPFFGDDFHFVQDAWVAINGGEGVLEEAVFQFLSNIELLSPGFIKFSQSLYENGDLATNLMTFISEYVKIE